MRQRLLSFQRILPIIGGISLLRLLWAKVFRTRIARLRVKGIHAPVHARLNNSDLSVLYQVFGLRECEVDVPEPSLIIDGGANVGYASLYLAERYPRAQIIAVEPSDGNCEIFHLNCAAHPNVRLVQGGIWSKRCLLEVCDPGERGWMIQVREATARTAASIEGYSIADLTAQTGRESIDILKLDIEGTEALLFSEGDLSWLDRVHCLIIETHGEAASSLVCDAMRARHFNHQVSGEKHVFTRP